MKVPKIKTLIKKVLGFLKKIFKKVGKFVLWLTKKLGVKKMLILGLILVLVLTGVFILISKSNVGVRIGGGSGLSRDKQRIKDIKLIQKAAEEYYQISVGGHFYPVIYRDGAEWKQVGGDKVILKKYPSDPSGIEYGSYSCAAGIDCNTIKYCVCARMENSKMGNSDVKCNIGSGSKDYYCAKNKN